MRNAEYSILTTYGVEMKGIVSYTRVMFYAKASVFMRPMYCAWFMSMEGDSSIVLFIRKQRGIPRVGFRIIPPCVCTWPYII